jgi:4-amino-4-deoxy-L-arabinose transferase-like glycosyltransferase
VTRLNDEAKTIDDCAHHVSFWPWVYLIALVYLTLHLATSTRYGYFRDALYYLACSEHLAFGYVDHPPLIVVLAWIARHTLGTSLPALLIFPALAGAGRVLLIAAFARQLGANRFGVALAAVLAIVPGVWWVMDHQFAMNTFEVLLWTGLGFVILRLIKTKNRRMWLAFGLIAGVGLETKYSIAFFVFALLAGMLLTRQRLLFTPWLLLGGGLAFVLFLPNLIWNIQHHWPFLELMHNISVTGKDVILPPGKYLLQQILMMNPASFPFWFGGLLFFFFSKAGKEYRAFGWAFVITIVLFLVTHGKDYYSAPAYGMLLAAGAIGAERIFASSRMLARPKLIKVLKPVCFVWLLIGVVPALPLVLPILPIETFLAYQSHLGIEPPRTERAFIGASLPQYYADEFNWPEMVEKVAGIYHSLPSDEEAKTAIFCNNYGEAAAIDFFGTAHDLPKSISGHQSYFLWGPRQYTGEIVILVGENEDSARQQFDTVEVAATQSSPFAFWYETQPILLCRGLKWDLQTGWSRVKRWR